MDVGGFILIFEPIRTAQVKSSHEIDQVMQAGKKNRSVGSTLMNQTSSRSHRCAPVRTR